MRKLRTSTQLFFFPAACFASVVWVAVFVAAGLSLPHPNLGLELMLAFAGFGLLLPWLMVTVAIGRRIDWNHDLTGATKP